MIYLHLKNRALGFPGLFHFSSDFCGGDVCLSAPNSHGESSQGIWKNYEGRWTPKPFLKVLIFQWIFFGCSQYLVFTSSLRKILPHQTDFNHLKGKPKSYRTQFSKKTTPATINAVPIALFAKIYVPSTARCPVEHQEQWSKAALLSWCLLICCVFLLQLYVSKPKKRLQGLFKTGNWILPDPDLSSF